ncbi:toll/interleukin-1 receptor domain-containing protein [Kitasatospora sp. MBT63]|uniref:toll/interleukin-1 receptor domain-containing protein n=1 Tax=Kitasatospora sp. MBT63 TaxID=1444768 RepID=UPI00053BB3F4|nr:toll/interleukin-1 receptor domain-containing protein [Kitasatospora sp. MBT63]
MHAFLSHNHRDKPLVSPLASRLRMLGVEVWLDSWNIAPGDSIPGKVNEALGLADTALVFWSSNAADSRWVDTEWQTAFTRRLSDDSVRIIPIVLDATPLPPVLRPIMYVSLTDRDFDRAAREVAGIKSPAEYNRRAQEFFAASGMEPRWFRGVGALVGCPQCGAPSSELEPVELEHLMEHTILIYSGARCVHCDWMDGTEE